MSAVETTNEPEPGRNGFRVQNPQSLTPPILILSDLHLAHPGSYLYSPRQLDSLFESARSVIFNGDAAELLNKNLITSGREQAEQLLELCAEHELETAFVTGNHDPDISNIDHLDLNGGRVFITHGDILHPKVAPWSGVADKIWAERQRLLDGHEEPVELEPRLRLSKKSCYGAADEPIRGRRGLSGRLRHLNKFASKPWRIVRTFHYWANVNRYSRQIRDQHRPRAKLMLIGHTHRPGIWRNRDFTLINTGSFQPMSYPLAVLLDDHHAVVHRVTHTGRHYRRGKEIYRVMFEE